jgi:hypothetical protein
MGAGVGNAHGTVGVCDGDGLRAPRGKEADGTEGTRGQEHADSDRGPQSGGGGVGAPHSGNDGHAVRGGGGGGAAGGGFDVLGMEGTHCLCGRDKIQSPIEEEKTGRGGHRGIGSARSGGGTQAAGSIGGRHKRRERERKGVSRRERESDS